MQKLPHEPIKITNEPVLRKRVNRQTDRSDFIKPCYAPIQKVKLFRF